MPRHNSRDETNKLPAAEQGELFRLNIEPSGLTDPAEPAYIIASIEEVPEGFFPGEDLKKGAGNLALNALAAGHAHTADVTRNRRTAQRGKHSPNRHPDGVVRPGDVFIDDSGERVIATYGNLAAAQSKYDDLRSAAPSRQDTLEVSSVLSREAEMTPHEKLMAVWSSSRAGFLPKTGSEQTTVLGLLDLPENGHQLFDYLEQTRLHSVKTSRAKGLKKGEAEDAASRVVESRVYEIGDYYTNAARSVAVLSSLGTELDGQGLPWYSVERVVGDHPGLKALVRYRDLKDYLVTTKTPDFNIMKRHENRSFTGVDGKNKTVEDPYTGQSTSPEVQRHLASRLSETTVKDARRDARAALRDETKRLAFWKKTLLSMKGRYAPLSRAIVAEQGGIEE